MAEFPYLDWLARDYKRRGEKSGNWTDYVKAHGIANFCLSREYTESRRRLVYDIENSWYKGNHPLIYTEHQQLTTKHEQSLERFREETRCDFDKLHELGMSLQVDEIIDQQKLKPAVKFSHKVCKAHTELCNQFVEISKEMIECSVNNLLLSGRPVPCNFAVIGLGSLAKGEATPYSDLEYAFIVEKESDYFQQLAVDTYFRIGNMRETPLKCFDIEELKALAPSQLGGTVGYRIDGLTEKAGNIPTGNGRDGCNSLTLTVDAFMDLYRKSSEQPFDGVAGDKSDMLSSTVLIYTNEGGTSQLYDVLLTKVSQELEKSSDKRNVMYKRVSSFVQDIKQYTFLPEFATFQPPKNTDIEVKPDIFRYPTLLANNIKMCLGWTMNYPWDVYSKLHQSQLISEEKYKHLSIVLAMSIYLRTAAYLYHKTQTDFVSLTQHSSTSERPRYQITSHLFVILGCLLVSVKHSVTSNADSLKGIELKDNLRPWISEAMTHVPFGKAVADKLWKAEVLYFSGEYQASKETVSEVVVRVAMPLRGAERALLDGIDCAKFVRLFEKLLKKEERSTQEKRADQRVRTKQTATKYVQLAAYLLYHTHNYLLAADYFQWLIYNKKEELVLWRLLRAHCMKEIGDLKTSRDLLDQIKTGPGDSAHHILRTSSGDVNHEDVYQNYKNIGSLYEVLGEYMEALDMFERALEISTSLQDYSNIAGSYRNIGNAYVQLSEYNKALDYHTRSLELLISMYGASSNHPNIAGCYGNIGTVYNCMGEYKTALEYYNKSVKMMRTVYGADTSHPNLATISSNIGSIHASCGDQIVARAYFKKSLEMREAVYGASINHSDISDSYQNIGSTHLGMGEYTVALEYYNKSLDMMKTVYGADNVHPSIANTYYNIGSLHIALGDYTKAMEYCREALDMMKAVYGTDTNHPAIANSYNNIGTIYYHLGDYTKALEYYNCSLQMMKTVYGADTKHLGTLYNNIGLIHNCMGDYTTALEFYNKSLEMRQSIYGTDTNHPDIANSYNNTALVYNNMGDFTTALEYGRKSLEMLKSTFGADSNHPFISSTYPTLGSIHNSMGDGTTALECYNQSLEMSKKVYGADSNHPDLATCYGNIGFLHIAKDDCSTALKLCNSSLEMRQSIYGTDTNHPDIADSYYNIGLVYKAMNDYTTAIDYLNKSLDMKKVVYGTNHLKVQECSTTIYNISIEKY